MVGRGVFGLTWFSGFGSFWVDGVVLDVMAEVKVGAMAEAVSQIHWPVARGGLFQCMLFAGA
jgi:succinate-acetate transporter protein